MQVNTLYIECLGLYFFQPRAGGCRVILGCENSGKLANLYIYIIYIYINIPGPKHVKLNMTFKSFNGRGGIPKVYTIS